MAICEARIAKLLTEPATAAPVVRHAVFRVVAVDTQFAFTRTLLPSGTQAVERFGPYSTQRAAHELAQRAAAQFRIQNPHCVVGVVDLDLAAPLEADTRPLWEVVEEKRREARAEKQRKKYAKRAATPEGRERLRERYRLRHARAMATPEGRERLREKWRKKPRTRASTPTCETVKDGVIPSCVTCGKPTGYYFGKALRFCQKSGDETRSACQVKFSNKLHAQRIKTDPEMRERRNKKQRDWNREHPEKRREKLIKDLEARRRNPRRWAAKLAEGRAYKARRRAAERATRQSADIPTGSVLLTASHRAPGRELLASIYDAVSPNLPPSLRMEIISETALLVLEGTKLDLAVAQASKSVRKNAAPLRYTKSIDDCFWLADETAFNLEASL